MRSGPEDGRGNLAGSTTSARDLRACRTVADFGATVDHVDMLSYVIAAGGGHGQRSCGDRRCDRRTMRARPSVPMSAMSQEPYRDDPEVRRLRAGADARERDPGDAGVRDLVARLRREAVLRDEE